MKFSDTIFRNEFFDILSSENKIQIIKNYKDFDLAQNNIIELLETIDDDDLKKDIIADRDWFRFSSYNLTQLIISLKGDDLKKDVIANYEHYNLHFDYIGDIVASISDDDYKKNIISNYESYGISYDDMFSIAAAINDDNYKKNLVQEMFNKRVINDELDSLIASIDDDQYKINVINNRKAYSFNTWEIFNIIKSIKDDDFKKQVMDNQPKYGISSINRLGVLTSIDDDEFKLEYIKNNDLTDPDFHQIFASFKYETKKQIIKEKHRVFNLTSILKNDDDDFKKELFYNYFDYNILSSDLPVLIASVKDGNFKKMIVEKAKEYNLDSSFVLQIVMNTNDDEFKRNIIENYRQYGISPQYLSGILITIKDEKIKRNLVADSRYNFDIDKLLGFGDEKLQQKIISENPFKLIKQSHNGLVIDYYTHKNEMFFKEILRSNQLDLVGLFHPDLINKYSNQIVMMIKNQNNVPDNLKFNKDLLNRAVELNDFNLILQFDMRILNESEKKELINNYELHKPTTDQLFYCVLSLEDENLKKIIINNYSKYGFDLDHVLGLLMTINDDEYKKIIIDKYQINFKNKIDLDPLMTIGIEIESEGPLSNVIPKFIFSSKWTPKVDVSLDEGVEVTSPILTSDSKNVNDIYFMCALLKKSYQSTSKRCGGHIHIGADYLKGDPQAYRNLLELYCNTEKILYTISNEKGEIPRDAIISASTPIASKMARAFSNNDIDLDNVKDMESLKEELLMVEEDRNYGINFHNLNTYMNTIEFRMPNGTIDPDIWIQNINIFGGLVYASKLLADIDKKPDSELTELDKIKLFFFERIKDDNVSDDEKLICLLNLMGFKEGKQTYVDKYRPNKALIYGTNAEKNLNQPEHPVIINKKEDSKIK